MSIPPSVCVTPLHFYAFYIFSTHTRAIMYAHMHARKYVTLYPYVLIFFKPFNAVCQSELKVGMESSSFKLFLEGEQRPMTLWF